MAAPAQRIGNILVIKLSALGDFVLAMGPFAAIRAKHPQAHITLLTTAPLADFARASPWFDEVWIDARPGRWQIGGILALRRRLRRGEFDLIYDLQTSDRSNFYFRLMGRPPWSGNAPGAMYAQTDVERDRMHTIDRQADQLRIAGITAVPPPSLDWVRADVSRFGLATRYGLLVPGGAPHRPAKRWPAARFIDLAKELAARDILPVLIGASADAEPVAAIAKAIPVARSLLGETTLFDIVGLARGAAGAVGNDSGPMHLIAAALCPSVVLFSAESDPALCAPRGRVAVLRRDPLSALEAGAVVAATEAGPGAFR